jgi:Flp pilus assembly protein CpaB
MDLAHRLLRRLRRRLLIHRRGLAVLCLAAAAWCALSVLRPPAPPRVPVWTASRDLDAGQVLAAADLRRVAFTPGTVPDRAVRHRSALVGRTLATPLTRGEVVTTVRLLGPGHLRGYPGRAAVGVRITDGEVADLLRPGDHVDVVGTDPQQRASPALVVRDAVVLAVPRSRGDPGLAAGSGRLVVVAVPAPDAERIASTGAALFLTAVWSR